MAEGLRNHMSDAGIRQANIDAGLALCPHCGGTGNEFLIMWRRCPMCDGTGNIGPHPSAAPTTETTDG